MDVERSLAAAGWTRTSGSAARSSCPSRPTRGSPGRRPSCNTFLRQAETDAAAIVPERIVPTKNLSRLALLLIPLLAAWVLAAFFLPPSRFLRPLFSLMMPWQETPTFLSDLIVQPGNLTIGQGERLEVAVRVNPLIQTDKDAKVGRAAIEVRDLAGGPATTTPARPRRPPRLQVRPGGRPEVVRLPGRHRGWRQPLVHGDRRARAER
jgi:hypothetical protein